MLRTWHAHKLGKSTKKEYLLPVGKEVSVRDRTLTSGFGSRWKMYVSLKKCKDRVKKIGLAMWEHLQSHIPDIGYYRFNTLFISNTVVQGL